MLTGCAGSQDGEIGYISDVPQSSETSAPFENEISDAEQSADSTHTDTESANVDLPKGFGGVSVLRFGSLPSARAVQQIAFYEENGEILITGGTTSKKPELYIFELSDGVISRKEIREIIFIYSKYLGTKVFSVSEKCVEIESIKHLDGKLYCVFNPDGDMERNYTELYMLTDGDT